MLFLCGATLVSGCVHQTTTQAGQSSATEPSGQHTVRLTRALERLPELLNKGDLLTAQLLREEIRTSPLAEGDEFKSLDQQFEQKAKEHELEITDDYLWLHRPAVDKAWLSALAKAKGRRTYSKSGLAVIRIRFEDPSREERIGALAQNLHIYFMEDDGYGGYHAVRSGDFLLLSRSQASRETAIEIKSMGHACPHLPIEVPAEGVAGVGEVLVRAAPPNQLGSLCVAIEPEGGVRVGNAMVRVGRRFAHYQGGYPVGPGGTCLIKNLAAGPCDIYAVAGEDFCCPHQQVTIQAGNITKLVLPLYARRRIEIQYKYRLPADEGEWEEGTTTVLTGRGFGLNLFGANGSLCTIGDWDGQQATIEQMNSRLLPAGEADFDDPAVPVAERFRDAAGKPCSLAPGKVFALRYRGQQSAQGEAVIRIRSMEPVSVAESKLTE